MKEYTVQQSFVGLLYEDGVFKKILEPGKHEFSAGLFASKVERYVRQIDMRERSLTIKGQEILTADKVAIRVSLLVYFKITNAADAAHNVASFEDRIYEDVQLAARRYLASRKLEQILTDRNEISDTVRDDVKETASSYGVQIIRADVKDLIFPGNLREIMNQVLETERKAEAKIIQARKDAEAARLVAEAENERTLKRLETEKQKLRLKAEAEQDKLKIRLAGEIEQAEAIAKHPEILKLRQLEVLEQLAANEGGRFVLGLEGKNLTSLFND